MPIKVKEVVVVADEESKSHNCTVYDLETGLVQAQLKGGKTVKHGMGSFGKDYLIGAMAGNPSLRVWKVTKEPECVRMPCVGIPSCLAVSDCGYYCAVAFNTMIYVWHIETGRLCMQLQQHVQKVTVMKFSDDGSRLVSGGEDGMVLVWQVAEATFARNAINVKPIYTWNDHHGDVTDIFIGGLSVYSRVATAAKDMSCRIYELHSGILLTSIHTDFPITAITMDPSETHLYMGSEQGEIYQVDLVSIEESEVHYGQTEDKFEFLGHGGAITSLSINFLGQFLVSGSEDKDCRIWDLKNCTCARIIHCSGTVTNAFVIRTPPALFLDHKNPVSFSVFRMAFDPPDYDVYIKQLQDKKLSLSRLGTPDNHFDSRLLDCSAEALEAMSSGHPSTDKMMSINTNMYSFSLGDHLIETYSNQSAGEEGKKEEEYY